MNTHALAGELRLLLKERADAKVTASEFPNLVALAESELDGPTRPIHTIDLQPFLDAAIDEVQDDVARESLRSLLGSGSVRHQSVKERATAAARNTGVSYDAYRRKDTGRMNTHLLLLAQSLAASVDAAPTLPPTPAVPPASVDEATPSTRRFALLAVPLALLIVLTAALALGRDDGSSATQAEATATAAADDSEAASTTPKAPTAELAAITTPATIGDGCFAPGETSRDDDAALAAAAAIAEVAGDAGPDACGTERVTKRGDVYWQRFTRADQMIGGFIAFERDGTTEAMFLNLGQWQSYIRVGGSDGSRSSSLAGLPTGELAPIGDLTSMVVTGDALLTAEDPAGTYYWMPGVAAEAWFTDRAADGSLGNPASSVYIVEGAFRVDFEHGYLEQRMDGTLALVLVDDAPSDLLPVADMAGHLISAADGTGWFVADDGSRWWIPDGERWDCAGGADNMVLAGLPGQAIHSLTYGGVADCPLLDATGTAPASMP